MGSSVCRWSDTSCSLQGSPTSIFYINLHDHIVQDLVLVMPFLAFLLLPVEALKHCIHAYSDFLSQYTIFTFHGSSDCILDITTCATFLLHCSMQLSQLMGNYISSVEVVMDDTCLTFRYLVILLITFSCSTVPSFVLVLEQFFLFHVHLCSFLSFLLQLILLPQVFDLKSLTWSTIKLKSGVLPATSGHNMVRIESALFISLVLANNPLMYFLFPVFWLCSLTLLADLVGK